MRAILTYHSIDASASPISIDEPTFRRHVEWLARGHVPVTSLAELLESPDGGPGIALTFDDALANFATRAWPHLRDAGLPVTLFIPTGRVGTDNRWSEAEPAAIPELPLLAWNELGRLADEGVTLGSHGHTHRDLRRLDDAELIEELARSAEAIAAQTGRDTDLLAYPYGGVDARVAAATARLYRYALTTRLRPLRPGDSPHLLPRVDAWYLRAPGRLEGWGSARLRAYLGLRAIARRARAGLGWI